MSRVTKALEKYNEMNSSRWGGVDVKLIKTGTALDDFGAQKKPIEFACPVCGETYATREEAEACRDQPYDTDGLKVGDIVVIPGKRLAYYEESDPWIAFVLHTNPENFDYLGSISQGVPYYVITALHPGGVNDRHRCLATVASMVGDRLTVGWTPANGYGHYSLYKAGEKAECPKHTSQKWHDRFANKLDKLDPCPVMKSEAAELAAIRIQSNTLL